METKEIIMAVCVSVICIEFMYTNYTIYEQSKQTNQYLNAVISDMASYQLYDPANKERLNKVGVYFGGQDYYCVKTYERDYKDIKLTAEHEMCHGFVTADKGHFCNGSNQTNFEVPKI